MSLPLIQTGPGGHYMTSYIPNGKRLVAVSGIVERLSPSDNWQSSSRGTLCNWNDGAAAKAQTSSRGQCGTLLDRLMGIDRVEISEAALVAAALAPSGDVHVGAHASVDGVFGSLIEAARTWLAAQSRAITMVQQMFRELAAPIASGECRLAVIAAAQMTGRLPAVSSRTVNGRIRQIVTRVRIDGIRIDGTERVGVGPGAEISLGHNKEEEQRYEPHTEAAQDFAVDSRFTNRSWLFANHAGARRRARHQQGDRFRARRSAHQKGRLEARSQQGSLFVHL